MTQTYQPLFSNSFLLATWNAEFQAYKESGADQVLQQRLKNWAEKDFQKETKAEQPFVQSFFGETWGYTFSGMGAQKDGYTCAPKLAVEKAGQKGGTGEADLALGMFGQEAQGMSSTPQVLCEFKDIFSSLDSTQNRKGNSRSPVKQCADYLREARGKLFGNEPIQPTWGIVTDMNEFRLYWWTNMPVQYQRFVIKPLAKHDTVGLIDDGDEAQFQRFLFSKIFHPNMLLTKGGKPQLEQLLQNQWVKEKELESKFYKEYRAFRENLFDAMVQNNKHTDISKSKLVRLSQRILDRLIFILYCEDMGKALSFPPHLLRDVLRHISSDTYYDPNGSDAWAKIKDIFGAMADGLEFAGHNINRFNGGLYSHDAILDGLRIPNSVFCAKGQHDNPSIDKASLLYLSATYNFGVTGAGGERVINLYTLGRIFEQSITELEIKVAEAEGRQSIGKLSKRKTDGVYYTPEWVTRFIIEQTVGRRLEELKKEIGWNDSLEITKADIKKSQNKDGTYNKSSVVWKYIQGFLKYEKALSSLKIVDPACGSGAFLIQSLEFLLEEHKRIGDDYNRFNPDQARFLDIEGLTRDILSNNIYGVDINSESVEIARLALWLHTAIPNRPLSNLDKNIQCGNSLVGPDFYERKKNLLSTLSEDQRDRVNAFDWRIRFAEVFSRENSGFDCVVGNPPYVRIQNFKKVDPETSEYLTGANKLDGSALYESTQTGSFDLYLPFIEQGINLLNKQGRMGYIAPSVWLKNKHGKGLRKTIHRGQHMDRWLDFVSYQVFDEATTYTALQFYKKSPAGSVHFANAPKGGVNVSDWEKLDCQIDYNELDPAESWELLPKEERKLVNKLNKACKPLDHYTSAIFQGIVTSSNYIYQLEHVGGNKFRHYPQDKSEPKDYDLEPDLMRLMVSGEDAKRYEKPKPIYSILIPYTLDQERPLPIPPKILAQKYPKTWAYLRDFEEELRGREYPKMDSDDKWYGYVYPKSLDKQKLPKLFVAGTAPELRLSADVEGKFSPEDKRVYSILPKDENDLFFLLAILNSPVPNFIFKRIARPKANGFFDIETQFLAPLPIPNAKALQKTEIMELAKQLQELTTKRRDNLVLLGKRLGACEVVKRPPSFLWPHLHDLAYWKAKNPKGPSGKESAAWAKQHFSSLLGEQLVRFDGDIPAGATLETEFKDGELSLKANGRLVIDGIFLDDEDGEFVAAQWAYLARITNVTEKTSPKTITEKLCTTYRTENPALQVQFLNLVGEVKKLEAEISAIEADLNQKICALYQLTTEEIKMVEAG
jgi:Eco57I restriction-modification methylase/TaqI-like C-terminal specificity domain